KKCGYILAFFTNKVKIILIKIKAPKTAVSGAQMSNQIDSQLDFI
ncbi:MAG: hypothetical protein QG603_599, partial [Patescibacteria group bacterium]|nr:hypothetical protein [Patescibacteria group bacterium]